VLHWQHDGRRQSISLRACQAVVQDDDVLLSDDLNRSFPLFERGMLCLLRVYSRYAICRPFHEAWSLLEPRQSLPRREQLHSRRRRMILIAARP